MEDIIYCIGIDCYCCIIAEPRYCYIGATIFVLSKADLSESWSPESELSLSYTIAYDFIIFILIYGAAKVYLDSIMFILGAALPAFDFIIFLGAASQSVIKVCEMASGFGCLILSFILDMKLPITDIFDGPDDYVFDENSPLLFLLFLAMLMFFDFSPKEF
jgi:hypothetical protein